MKPAQLTVGIILLLLSGEVHAQKVVYDIATDMQRQRMVMTRWNQFKPDGLFDVYWGLFHSAYMKTDHRPLGPVGPYLTHEGLLKNQDDQDKTYRLSTDSIANTALMEDINSEGGVGDLPYSFYFQGEFRQLQTQKDNTLLQEPPTVLAYLLKTKLLDWYNTERGVLDDRIANIHKSYMERGPRILAYQRIEDAYTILTNSFSKAVYLAHQAVFVTITNSSFGANPFKEATTKMKSDQALGTNVIANYKFK